MGSSRETFICICLAVVFFLIIILVPLIFSYVEYYEYGLVRVSATGKVDTSKVYDNGRYALGIYKSFLKYQADAHFVELKRLPVFSAGGSNASIGLSFWIDVDFTFMLNQHEIGLLHEELALSYHQVIVSRAKDAIKNEAIFITFLEYFEQRQKVERRFREAVTNRWNATPSVHASLDQFHLGRIRITDSVAEKQLDSIIQNELNDREDFLQQAQLERELTAVGVNAILLERDNILRTSQAEASLVRAKANAQAKFWKEEAQLNGTALLFEAANIQNENDMTAYTYIRNLDNREKMFHMKVTYVEPDSVMRTMAV